MALTVAGGALQAVQARLNGSMAQRVGTLPASVVSFSVGLAALAALVAASPVRRRAVALTLTRGLPWWWRLGGLGGASVVAVSALGVPLMGVALVSICLVAGSTVGSLMVDRLGLGPGSSHRLTPSRLAGAAMAVTAVGLAGAGRFKAAPLVLFVALVAAGVLGAGQAAANGRLSVATGEPVVAALVNFTVGLGVLAVVTGGAALAGLLPTPTWPGNPMLYVGGLGGTVFIVVAALTVRPLGVLRLTLATVAGQLLGAVGLDLAAPGPGGRLPLATLLGAGLTLLAVAVAGRGPATRPLTGPLAVQPTAQSGRPGCREAQ